MMPSLNDSVAVGVALLVTAMLVMWLWTMLAANLFAAFYRRNLKPALRAAYDTLQIARLMYAELYESLPIQPRAP